MFSVVLLLLLLFFIMPKRKKSATTTLRGLKRPGDPLGIIFYFFIVFCCFDVTFLFRIYFEKKFVFGQICQVSPSF
jgi:hypothetical protein